jgi:hypothetical protein
MCCGSKHMKVGETKAEAGKHKIRAKIFQLSIDFMWDKYKAWELAKSHVITWHHFMVSMGWCVCVCVMRKNGVCLHRRTSLCEKLPADFEKLVAFLILVIWCREKNSYLLSQIGNADEMPGCFGVPFSSMVDDRQSLWWVKCWYGKMHITVMLVVLANGGKLPPHLILNCKTVPKEQMHGGTIVRCQQT